MKKCTQCKKLKSLDLFSKDKTRNDGLNAKCKICARLARQKLTEIGYYRKRYQQSQENPENRIKRASYHQDYNQKYRVLMNQKEQREYHNRYYHEQKHNPQFKIARNARTRIWIALKGNTKIDSTMNLIGCTRKQLIEHLERQFETGMSWENYGNWHVDHVKPCSSFDLTNPENQRVCFHFTNLQPLWALENIAKSDNLTFHVQ